MRQTLNNNVTNFIPYPNDNTHSFRFWGEWEYLQDVVHKYLAVRGLQAHARDISMDQGQPYTFRPRHQGNLWLSMIEILT